MLALHVDVNGRMICIAGMTVGAVSSSVAIVTKPIRPARPSALALRARAVLTVSGFRPTPSASVNPWWVNPHSPPRLKVGDRIMIRIVDTSKPSRPITTQRYKVPDLESYERRQYRRLKRKFEKKKSR